ncbi:hypothetical protein OIV83_003499 [Microbotryomycetes sp. JL201]|nr:hypothetical protein OIV83_003499 [Microbotryomycetes sp. JL201]
MNGTSSTNAQVDSSDGLKLLHTHGSDSSDNIYQRCKRIRYDCFVLEQGYPERVETEPQTISDDSKCDHLLFVSTEQGRDIGCLRIDSETFKLGRVVVVSSARGTGLGLQMMNELDSFVQQGRGRIGKFAIEKGLQQVRLNCDSQSTARRFYEKCGWSVVGDEFVKEGQPHVSMCKTIELQSAISPMAASPSRPMPINAEYSILLCETAEDKQRCLEVRKKVFVEEQKFPLEDEVDEKEESSDHLLLVQTHSNASVGTIRYWPPGGKLGRLAVLPQFRSIGAGRMLVEAFEAHIKSRRGLGGKHAAERGLRSVKIIASSQYQVEMFYAKNGYTREGDLYDEDGWPHVKMVKTVELEEAPQCDKALRSYDKKLMLKTIGCFLQQEQSNGNAIGSRKTRSPNGPVAFTSKPIPINSEYSVLLCESTEDKQKCMDVRIKVFVEEQKFRLEDEIDDKDDTSDHLLLVQTHSQAPVGTIRYWPPGGKLGRLAVLPQFRSIGAGRMLVEAFEAHVKSRQGLGGKFATEHGLLSVHIVASAQHQAEKFYTKSGYTREGDLYDEDGWPHVKMVKTLQLD